MLVLVMQCLAGLALILLAAGLALRLLLPLPPLEPRPASSALTDTDDTPLGRGIATLQRQQRPGHSGIRLLAEGQEAFAARVLLARAAVSSLDIQYYIWHMDLSGRLMLDAVREAADRGVRVRMLLDDNGVAGMDPVLATLDQHPNIEIRLFNPFTLRTPKMLGYLADFPRLNRRMHNKSFTADGRAAIIGGRNVGDEYFGARDGGLFFDVDVLAVGPIVGDVSRDFDRYWASQSAYPANRILPAIEAEHARSLYRDLETASQQPGAQRYIEAVRALSFLDQVMAGDLDFAWSEVRMVSDDPAKAVGKAPKARTLLPALRAAIGTPRRDVNLISGYFVPGEAGTKALAQLPEQGVEVSILTNAFKATDVWIVHAGYAHRRKALLSGGVRLFEMMGPAHDAPRRSLTATGSGSSIRGAGQVLRSSSTTVHAKTFVVDDARMFVGSFNFDPRSLHLNTELGFIIENPALAREVAERFAAGRANHAYEVILADDGSLNWVEQGANGAIVHTSEPGMSWGQRIAVRVISYLPIEWML